MSVEGAALIPRCAECEASWLPADDERWCAYLTDDEPAELAFYCPGVLSESSAATEPTRSGSPRQPHASGGGMGRAGGPLGVPAFKLR